MSLSAMAADPLPPSVLEADLRRYRILGAVRWLLVGFCLYLLSSSYIALAVLGPLLLLAALFGRPRWWSRRLAVLPAKPAAVPTVDSSHEP